MLKTTAPATRITQRRVVTHLASPILLALICAPLVLVGLDGYPAPWFDEGFKLNSARLLAETGLYGSRSADGVILFDMATTSGPLEIGLMALSLKLFGLGVFQGRLPIALLTVVLILLVERFGRTAYGGRAGLLMALLLLAAPPIGDVGVVLIGRQALNETPAMLMVVLGLLALTRSWERGSTWMALLAGMAFGVGALSKSQFAIPLLPALALIGGARLLLRHDPPLRAAAPAAGLLIVFFGWSLLGRLAADPATQLYNQEMLRLGLSANLFTGLWGSTLSARALLIAAIGLAGAGYGAWRFGRAWHKGRARAADWLTLTLALIAVGNTIWFSLISIGWPRYGYLGYVAALMLLGLLAAEALAMLQARIARRRPGHERLIPMAFGVGLAALAAIAYLPPALRSAEGQAAAQMAAYIEQNLPREARIETWEWELGALGAHTNYHYPDQQYVYLATYQQGRRLPYRLDYDMLEAAPTHLVTGPFSGMTQIYPPQTIAANFVPVVTIGPYQLFERRR